MKNNKGFFSLLGVIFSIIMFLFIIFLVYKSYWVRPVINKETNKQMQELGIDSSSYQKIKESTQKKIEDINKQYETQLNQLGTQTAE